MLGMSVCKRQNDAYIVPGRGDILPGTRAGFDGEIAVVEAVLPFVDEDKSFCRGRMEDVTFSQVGGIPCDERRVASHLTAHRDAPHPGKRLSPNLDRGAVGGATIDFDTRVVREQFAIADIVLVGSSRGSAHIAQDPRITQETGIAQSDVPHPRLSAAYITQQRLSCL